MEENTGVKISLMFGLFLFLIAGIGGGFWYFFYREGNDPFTIRKTDQLRNRNVDAAESTVTQSGRRPEDINDDGTITVDDISLIQIKIGCSQQDDCWDDVIGKTLSGDNPIYTFDLDVDKDGTISAADSLRINSILGQ